MKLEPISSGEIIQEEFLESMKISEYRIAKSVHIPQSRVSGIISGKRGFLIMANQKDIYKEHF